MNNIKKLRLTVFFLFLSAFATAQRTPNIIIILADDMGYGDLGSFGHPTIRTPFLDQMAGEGMRFTQFYVGANVCTPSRGALLTGRLPIRYGLTGGTNVFFPYSVGGLPQTEITIATALKTKGYHTALVGKWHLGHLPQFMPNSHGFDYYFGLPYSNDMSQQVNKQNPPLPLYRNREVIELEPDQSVLTQRYTDEAVNFIKTNKDKPFFLYYANNFPHIPLHASPKFKNKSKRGLYGDVVEELDWSVGQILKTLKDLKIDKNTLVIFTSDNGPWLPKKEQGGAAGLLYEGKGSSYEGGMREPAIAWWPGTIKAKQVNTALATTMDLFPTIMNMVKVPMPAGKIFDGVDIMPLFTGKSEKVRDVVYYYHRNTLHAIRIGQWKAHFITQPSYSAEPAVSHDPPLLYNIEHDPSEKYNVNKQHPEVLEQMKKEFDKHKAGVIPVPTQLKPKNN